MALIHTMSKECLKSELDIFRVPMTQTSIEQSYYVEVPPLTALNQTSPVEFHVAGCTDYYMDLNNSYLFIRAKITKADGSNLTANDSVGFVNYAASSIFSQLDVTLGDRIISHSSNSYPYRCIIECLTNYNREALDIQFGNALFSMDTAGHMDVAVVDGNNAGLKKRGGYTANSRTIEMTSAIHSDIFHQDRLLINGIDLKLKFTRSKNSFCLMNATAEEYKVVLENVSLFIKKVGISPPVRLAHAKALQQANARYPIDRVVVKTYSLTAGSRVAGIDHLFLGKIPEKVVIGFVNDIAFNGSYAHNPFNFHHYDIEFFCLYIDGQQFPAKPYQGRLERGGGAREYQNLYASTGCYLKNQAMAIDRDQFISGYTLYCFNLNADDANGGHMSLARNGNARVELRFANPLPHTINMICYSVETSIIEISSRRQVLTEF